MFHSILVPLDGSSRAERPLSVAARIAWEEGGSVVLFRALPLPLTSAPLFGQDANSEWLLEEEVACATAYLDDVKGSQVLRDIAVSCVVRGGDPAQVILEYAEAHQVGLIVLCSHGRSNLGRWVLASVAEHLVRHASMPILVVRTDGATPLASNAPEHLFCALVPLDGSTLAEAAIGPAIHLATALAAPQPAGLHLVVVVNPFEATGRQSVPEATLVDNAKRYLICLTDRLRLEHPHLTVTWSVRMDADAETGILLVAQGEEGTAGVRPLGGCELIVMTSHGRTGFLRWALGGVAERVLHAALVPVLLVRSAQGAVTTTAATPENRAGPVRREEAVLTQHGSSMARAGSTGESSRRGGVSPKDGRSASVRRA